MVRKIHINGFVMMLASIVTRYATIYEFVQFLIRLVFASSNSETIVVKLFLPKNGDQRGIVSGMKADFKDLMVNASRDRIAGRDIVIKRVSILSHLCIFCDDLRGKPVFIQFAFACYFKRTEETTVISMVSLLKNCPLLHFVF
jgi:hypothetical protein